MSQALSLSYPVQVLCEVLGVPRSSYYYAPHNAPQDAILPEAIEGILMRMTRAHRYQSFR